MTALTLPAPDAHASEWGALAVSIPGWPWMPGMLGYNDYGGTDRIMDHSEASQINAALTPDPDDPATAGCLLALHAMSPGWHWVEVDREHYGYRLCRWMGRAHEVTRGPLARNPGRACIAAAAALGRWPGGGA